MSRDYSDTPAFPTKGGMLFYVPKEYEDGIRNATEEHELTKPYHGVTVRDYLAATIDIPWNAVMETLSHNGNSAPTLQEVVDLRAQIRYLEADAMLVESRKS